MLGVIWDLLCFAVALGILVTVHEAGHFFAARLCKVHVLRFCVGFGKPIFMRRGRDGCEYAVAMIPLGGYVKMQGENEDDASAGSFKAASLISRAFIIAAGPLCNVLLAVLLYLMVNLMGVETLRPVVGDVTPDSPAARAGMTVSSEITSVNGRDVRSWSDVVIGIMTGPSAEAEICTVPFEGQGRAGCSIVSLTGLSLDPDGDVLGSLGLQRMAGRISSELTTVQPESPAFRAGLREGDRIVSIDGSEIDSWYRVLDAVRGSNGRTLSMLVERDGRIYEAQVTPDLVYSKRDKNPIPMIGAGITVEPVPALSTIVSYGPVDGASKAVADTFRMSKLVASAVVRMVGGGVSADSISGPIAIAKGAGASASIGLVFFLSFLAAISVNLGILNLLPIPVLDGGQLMFIAFEALTGRAPSARMQRALSLLGFSVLLSLMLFAVFNDIRGL